MIPAAPLQHSTTFGTFAFALRCPFPERDDAEWFSVASVESTPQGLVISRAYCLDEKGGLETWLSEKFAFERYLEVVVRESRGDRALLFHFKLTSIRRYLPLSVNALTDGLLMERLLLVDANLEQIEVVRWPSELPK
jgi:hypothetical protein